MLRASRAAIKERVEREGVRCCVAALGTHLLEERNPALKRGARRVGRERAQQKCMRDDVGGDPRFLHLREERLRGRRLADDDARLHQRAEGVPRRWHSTRLHLLKKLERLAHLALLRVRSKEQRVHPSVRRKARGARTLKHDGTLRGLPRAHACSKEQGVREQIGSGATRSQLVEGAQRLGPAQLLRVAAEESVEDKCVGWDAGRLHLVHELARALEAAALHARLRYACVREGIRRHRCAAHPAEHLLRQLGQSLLLAEE